MHKRRIFIKVYLSVAFVILMAILTGLFVFWNFLSDYEETRPTNVIENIIYDLRNGNNELLLDSIDFTPTEFEDPNIYKRQIISALNGDLTYFPMPDKATEEKLVYKIKSDGQQIAIITLIKTDTKSPYGFEEYKIDNVKTAAASVIPSITVSAPSYATVYLNGVKVSESYLKSSADIPNSEHFKGFLSDNVTMKTYEINGLLTYPEITSTAYDGTFLSCDENNVFALKSTVDEELSNMALDFSHNYSRYIANDAYFNVIGDMIPEELELYQKLSDYEENFYTWHSGYEFTDDFAYNPLFYSENCFSCRVTYSHVIYSTETFTFPADNTIYFTLTDSGWMVTDIVMI